MTTARVRENFSAAAEGFALAVAATGHDAWDDPGLGVWTVRDLIGHTSRALSTIETYLAVTPTELTLRDPLDYLLAVRGSSVDPAAIAQRGREAGVAFGSDPEEAAAAIRALAARVTALVAATPDDAPLSTALGGSTLLAYLPTRTFELTVHTLDLVGAVGLAPPTILAGPVAACLELAAEAAARGGHGPAVLLALTGRQALPPGLSVV